MKSFQKRTEYRVDQRNEMDTAKESRKASNQLEKRTDF